MLQRRSYGYTATLGWSISRYDSFSTCRRQYFYQYYARHDREHSVELIQSLRQLTTIPMETGSAVHDIIATVLGRLLRSHADIDRERFAQFVARQVEERVGGRRFSEVHYAEVEAVQPHDLLPAVQECLDTFLASRRYTWIRDEALQPGHGNEWIIEPEGFGECRIAGMKAYCKVDFAFLVGSDMTILDWKSGRRDEAKHGRQLLAYAAWAVHEQGAIPGQVETVVAYLRREYAEAALRPAADEVDAFVTRMQTEAEEMRSLCHDPQENRPLAKDAFPMTESRAVCRHCVYRQLCGRE